MKLAALVSSGKDSLFATYLMKKKGHEIACLVTIKSRNKSSYMFHTPNVGLVRLQAEAMNLPLITWTTAGVKEAELLDLKAALKQAKKEFSIKGIITGAIESTYQRDRIEGICNDLSLKCLSPLWHIGQEKEMRALLREGFKIILVSIAAEGLDASWLGREITGHDVDKLVELNKGYGINIAGEGGEFESLVVDCPLFSKRIEVPDHEVVEEGKNTAYLVVKGAKLVGND